MTGERTFDTVMKVLRDPAYAGLAREAVRDYISWAELVQRPPIDGLTASETWRLLSATRRLGATTFPIPVVTGEVFWYTITIEGRHCLRTIERHCRSDSRLHQMVQHRTGQHFLVSSRIEEAIATCQTDGMEADADELERMLQEGRAPRTPEGRLVRNTYEMLGELQSLVDEDFSPELVLYLYERTIHGLELGSVRRSGAGLQGVPTVFHELLREFPPPGTGPAGAPARESAEDALQQICDYANGATGDAREPVAVKGYLLLASMGYWHPLPDYNATVARHMLRLLSVKRDFPVLGYLRTSAMARAWVAGRLERGRVRYARIEPTLRTEDGMDGTAEVLTHLQLTVAALDDLRSRIRSTKEVDEALARTLHDAGRFNYRQRGLLTHALRCPEAEFTLREHRLTHRTVYSTARADLLELAELGYLEKQTRGQAFVFTPAPDLRDRLSRVRAGE